MTAERSKNLAAFLLGQLARHPPDLFVSAFASMLDDERARPVVLPTTDAELDAAALVAFEESCDKQWPRVDPRSILAESTYPIFLAGFKAAFKAYVVRT